ncbi:MAG: hypothetical protein A3J83_07830 [Elusimicrobia bacterium RIFOXYA2_FULL_40_6]|nr:MAG: hypothetical protein A3J83_07830 [Elusimicrobia bacterium RIFOXYA2_FULL_40_6]
MKKIFLHLAIYSSLLALLTGCGAKYTFNRAKTLEKKGFYVQAIEKYKKVSSKYPNSTLAPEALYNAGNIYQTELKIYNEGLNTYLELIKNYPDSNPWIKLAKMGVFNSPNYFPLAEGYSWNEGDSVSVGKNMNVEWYCQEISTGMYKLTKKYFAGRNLVTTVVRYLNIDNFELIESKTPDFKDKTILLKYPFNPGNSWETEQDGRKLRFTITDNQASVKVDAGVFDNCLKVQQEDLNLRGSYKYIYYAKNVGFVLMSVGTTNAEHRNSELLSYSFKAQ